MSSDDLGSKLALLREQNRSKRELQTQRFEEKKQEILLHKKLSDDERSGSIENNLEAIRLRHELDEEVRERDRSDAVFFKNLDLQEFFKTEQLKQSHLLEEIHHTALAQIFEKAILMILETKLTDRTRMSSHFQEKDLLSHKTDEEMRFERFKTELTSQYGQLQVEEILRVIEENREKWDREFKTSRNI